MQGQLDDLGDLVPADRGLTAPALAYLTELDNPSAAKRSRQDRTVATDTPTSVAIALLATPSAASNNALRALNLTMRRGSSVRQRRQRLTLAFRHRQGSSGGSAHQPSVNPKQSVICETHH